MANACFVEIGEHVTQQLVEIVMRVGLAFGSGEERRGVSTGAGHAVP